MTVHALIPVFNRLPMTQTMLGCLRKQALDEPLSITVVDDGSTDGTEAYLREQTDVTTLRGDGNLWWGGAIDKGLRHILAIAAPSDWVLFVNNDTQIAPDFVRLLLNAARKHQPAAVGSVVRNTDPPYQVLSVGPRIHPWTFDVREIRGDELDDVEPGISSVDALSGRGVLYPVAALRQVSGMRPSWLPHYLADYEVSLRVKAAGWKLLVSHSAGVHSRDEYGSSSRSNHLYERLFSVRSPNYLPAQLRFWWQASNALGKITFPLRLPLAFAWRRFRKRFAISGQVSQ